MCSSGRRPAASSLIIIIHDQLGLRRDVIASSPRAQTLRELGSQPSGDTLGLRSARLFPPWGFFFQRGRAEGGVRGGEGGSESSLDLYATGGREGGFTRRRPVVRAGVRGPPRAVPRSSGKSAHMPIGLFQILEYPTELGTAWSRFRAVSARRGSKQGGGNLA